MSYKFSVNEPVEEAIVRAAREQLDRAVTELSEGVSEDPVKAVHSARKAIKKERSLLRLARGSMSRKQRRGENRVLREAARALSGTRDADVMVAALDGLAERFVGQLPATTFDAIREQLNARRARTNGASGGAPDAQAVQELGSVRLRVDDWQLRKQGWGAIEAGLNLTFKRGRKAFARAKASRSPEDLHDWRKRVKDLWYQQRLLAPTGGLAVRGQAKEAHRLADLLGDDHDLFVLREVLVTPAMTAPVDVDAVVKLLDLRRDELQLEALALGKRVYAESPKAFRRRMKRLWLAGQALGAAPLERDPAEVAAATREPQPS